LNNYQYVPNPTGWVDPLGLNECPGGDGCKPGKTGRFLDKPADSNGSLNIGAGENPLEGYYNLDIDPKVPGVHAGDATNLPGIKTGSQSNINIDNPFGFDPLNSEILRVLSPDGKITMTGSSNANGYLKKAIKKIELLGFKVVSRTELPAVGYKTVDGKQIRSKALDKIVIQRAK
jgi:uncharacterized protein RhaS with RHS repeats